MSFSLPTSYVSDIANVIRGGGEDVTYVPLTGASVALKASVQNPYDVGLIADASQEALVLFVSTLDLAEKPVEFDRFLVRGRTRTVNEAHGVAASNTTIAWQVLVSG